jgi:hypothetical protein
MKRTITIILVIGMAVVMHGGSGYQKVRQINNIKQEVCR